MVKFTILVKIKEYLGWGSSSAVGCFSNMHEALGFKPTYFSSSKAALYTPHPKKKFDISKEQVSTISSIFINGLFHNRENTLT